MEKLISTLLFISCIAADGILFQDDVNDGSANGINTICRGYQNMCSADWMNKDEGSRMNAAFGIQNPEGDD